MEATICERTIAYGPQRYRVDSRGQWTALMVGTIGPQDNMVPRWRWMPIPEDRVPDEVKEAAR